MSWIDDCAVHALSTPSGQNPRSAPPLEFSQAADATDGTRQGGQATIGGVGQAALWSGSAESFIDMNPTGSTQSQINAMTLDYKAGAAVFGGQFHAGTWTGAASSFVDLNPSFATSSAAFAAEGSYQAGYGYVDGNQHAVAWNSTAESAIDLHVLTTGYSRTFARGISVVGPTVFVVGYGQRPDGIPEAVLWKYEHPVPEPATMTAISLNVTLLLRKKRHRL